MPGRRGHAPLDDSGLFVKSRIRYDFRYVGIGGGVRPRDKQAVTAVNDRFRNEGNLFGGLALAKHNLRKPLTGGAVVIDARESQVLERLADAGEPPRAPLGIRRIEASLADGVEQRAQRIDCTDRVLGRLLHGFTFDSAKIPSIEWRVVARRPFLIL
jgi:hypothetical protein